MWRKSEDIGESEKIEGRNPVLEALKNNRPLNKIVIANGQNEGVMKQIFGYAKEKGIVIQEVDKSRLDAISDTGAHQGVIAYTAAAEYVEVEDILNKARGRGEDPFIVILDEITDPQNLGAIIRTCDAAGVHGVIIPKRRAVGLTAVVAKASAGAIEYVPVARVANISQTIDHLKKEGVWVIGTDPSGDKPYHKADYNGSIAIVIGNEGAGISRLVKENCDFVVRIPMKGKVASLNASAATALMLFEVVKQRLN
ncbi:MAG: 23S rRNA (guanosine(2251)-2'-O)-methyltransferase RlmB [Clostridia bacterium]